MAGPENNQCESSLNSLSLLHMSMNHEVRNIFSSRRSAKLLYSLRFSSTQKFKVPLFSMPLIISIIKHFTSLSFFFFFGGLFAIDIIQLLSQFSTLSIIKHFTSFFWGLGLLACYLSHLQ